MLNLSKENLVREFCLGTGHLDRTLPPDPIPLTFVLLHAETENRGKRSESTVTDPDPVLLHFRFQIIAWKRLKNLDEIKNYKIKPFDISWTS